MDVRLERTEEGMILWQFLHVVRQGILLLIQKEALQAFDELVALCYVLPLQPSSVSCFCTSVSVLFSAADLQA